jgi:predicted Rossmann fold nucleotide-binding protein DprA/Smf involved in DNA uptake
MINSPTPPDDSLVLLLLCSTLAASETAPSPLSPREWFLLQDRLPQAGLGGPAALLEADPDALSSTVRLPKAFAERLKALLGRKEAVLAELTELGRLGIWPLTSADAAYPTAALERMGNRMPQVLFGVGDASRLRSSGVAIVGSRNVDAAGSAYAERLGQLCAGAGLTVISGGARGVDLQAMEGALRAGGGVLAVLADRLVTAAARLDPEYAAQLTLLACVHPRLGFSRGIAMQRNRVIHALGRYALVVASAEYGGTWNGSLENLAHRWSPVFVRAGADVPVGNRELLRRGARPLPEALPGTPAELMRSLDEAGRPG